MATFDQQHQKILTQINNAGTMNVLVSQLTDSRKKKWRPLEHVNYAVLEDTKRYRDRFLLDACWALDDVFKQAGYSRVTALFEVRPRAIGDQTMTCYSLTTHQIKFAHALRQRGIERTKKFFQTQEELKALDDAAREAYLHKINSENSALQQSQWQNWHMDMPVHFTSRISPVELIFDPDTLNVAFRTVQKASLDPAEYPDHMTTTTEALEWIGTALNSTVGFVGDIFAWGSENLPLTKLMAYVLDENAFDLNAIRINVSDFEEWDFMYPDFETEILNLKMKKEAKK